MKHNGNWTTAVFSNTEFLNRYIREIPLNADCLCNGRSNTEKKRSETILLLLNIKLYLAINRECVYTLVFQHWFEEINVTISVWQDEWSLCWPCSLQTWCFPLYATSQPGKQYNPRCSRRYSANKDPGVSHWRFVHAKFKSSFHSHSTTQPN